MRFFCFSVRWGFFVPYKRTHERIIMAIFNLYNVRTQKQGLTIRASYPWVSRWWFQIFFIFTPAVPGEMIGFDLLFKWVETTPPQVSLKKALLRFMKTLIYFVSGGTRRKTEGSGGRGLSTQGLYAWLVGQRVSWKMNDDDFRITTS